MNKSNKTIAEIKLSKLGTAREIIKNEYMMYALVAYNEEHRLLETLFKKVNQGIKDKTIKEEDLDFFRSGKLIDAIVHIDETARNYGNRKPFKSERLIKLENIKIIEDLNTLITSYTHPSIINALCGKGGFYDRIELTYFIEDGTYNKLPEAVKMAIISEVLKTNNIEVAQSLLNLSIGENKTYKTKNRYLK